MQTPQKKAREIQRLLNSFPSANPADPVQYLNNFMDVAEDFHAELVEAGVTILIKGLLPGFDGRFAPTAPMLATACRKAADDAARKRYLDGLNAPRLPPPEIQKTDDQRARACAKMQQAIDNLSAGTALESAEALAAEKARWGKVNVRFAPDMSEDAIMDRLVRKGRGWTTGNDYGDAA